jgi:hypothetical protein
MGGVERQDLPSGDRMTDGGVPAAGAPTALSGLEDWAVTLQRSAGNRAVSDILTGRGFLQRQPRPVTDPAAQARADADAPAMGEPAKGGSSAVQIVAGADVPGPDALAYPPIPAPDTSSRYENYYRVRYKTVWVLRRIGPWTPVAGDASWQRELEWGRLRIAATETWLVKKGWLWDSNVSVTRGGIYLASEPFSTTIRRQSVAPPPAAEGGGWQPSDGAVLTDDHIPEPGLNEAIETQTARTLAAHTFAVNVVRAVTGGSPARGGGVEAGGASTQGGQFVILQIIRALVANNALISSVFDASAIWVRSVPAPGNR